MTIKKLPGSKSRPYRSWNGLKSRCKNKNLKNYGGKGITYDPKWEKFAGFWEDMGETYKDNLTIDRIDNNGNYCKENCRWATSKEQMANFSGNTWFEYKDRKMILSDWARELGIRKQTLIQRIYKFKEPIEYALSRGKTKPHKQSEKRTDYKEIILERVAKGETQLSVAKSLKIHPTTVSHLIVKERKLLANLK